MEHNKNFAIAILACGLCAFILAVGWAGGAFETPRHNTVSVIPSVVPSADVPSNIDPLGSIKAPVEITVKAPKAQRVATATITATGPAAARTYPSTSTKPLNVPGGAVFASEAALRYNPFSGHPVRNIQSRANPDLVGKPLRSRPLPETVLIDQD
jgi:hypothetical protein